MLLLCARDSRANERRKANNKKRKKFSLCSPVPGSGRRVRHLGPALTLVPCGSRSLSVQDSSALASSQKYRCSHTPLGFCCCLFGRGRVRFLCPVRALLNWQRPASRTFTPTARGTPRFRPTEARCFPPASFHPRAAHVRADAHSFPAAQSSLSLVCLPHSPAAASPRPLALHTADWGSHFGRANTVLTELTLLTVPRELPPRVSGPLGPLGQLGLLARCSRGRPVCADFSSKGGKIISAQPAPRPPPLRATVGQDGRGAAAAVDLLTATPLAPLALARPRHQDGRKRRTRRLRGPSGCPPLCSRGSSGAGGWLVWALRG